MYKLKIPGKRFGGLLGTLDYFYNLPDKSEKTKKELKKRTGKK